MKKAIIMAGGQGTRMAGVLKDIPKPMAPICGKPILEYQIENLTRYGATDILIVVGPLGGAVREYFGDGAAFGARISYITEETPLGTAGALYYVGDFIGDEDVPLFFGDILCDVDLGRFIAYHREKGAAATLLAHPNSHPFDSDLVVAGADGRVTGWDSKHNTRGYDYKNLVNSGLYVVTRAVSDRVKRPEKTDLEKDIVIPMIDSGGVYAYASCEYVKDAGTPERYAQAESDCARGIVRRRNLSNKQKCVFLDRDGTLNESAGFIARPDGLRLIGGVAEAVKRINRSEYLAVVATNQPVVARGDCTAAELDAVHRRLETLLGREGAYLDGLYYCPHHPDKGFPGEVSELKTDCGCRKPKTGLLTAAARDFNIDLSASYLIGDGERDTEAARRAGARGIRVETDAPGQLLEAVDKIVGATP
ncbi:MAG: HAD-IIIA family hydrolase [Clostridiales bacterium]|jgi:D,D-heptose 1,7-bisphosphate phosphatase|nr:HAD-IIIA family hydrolase [Clostridiales bacterium]